ncbi:MAG: anthranilate synthase component I family protein [Planctomycetota bacterium]|nr:anthranilate synthase component I family protein [Planctomycetota bacterium]
MLNVPMVEELSPAPEPDEVFRSLRHLPGCIFLDSARRVPQLGGYSFVAADPCDWIVSPPQDPVAGLDRLSRRLQAFHVDTIPDLPPFQGGAAGFFAYDLGRIFEPTVLPHAHDDLHAPQMAVGLYDVVIGFDHAQSRAWIISQGYPERDPIKQRIRAERRLREFRLHMTTAGPSVALEPSSSAPSALLAPAKPVTRHPFVVSDFTESEYLAAVQHAIDYVHAGDIFQVNIAQRLACPAMDSATELYLRLRTANPAPFAAYFDAGSVQIMSASPERFWRISENSIETRPIKGTRPRSLDRPEADLFAGTELRESAKDRSENIMIVDLLRNDLARLCLPDSIHVPQLCQLETYAFVQHLVSVVTGTLRPNVGIAEVVRSTFPGGSITGAPKVRAMQIIAELEHAARGPYCGSLGYWGWNGASDWNLLIRTITASRGWWHFPVGGGIVADSDPRHELDET